VIEILEDREKNESNKEEHAFCQMKGDIRVETTMKKE
jgi:hypothetical protein